MGNAFKRDCCVSKTRILLQGVHRFCAATVSPLSNTPLRDLIRTCRKLKTLQCKTLRLGF